MLSTAGDSLGYSGLLIARLEVIEGTAIVKGVTGRIGGITVLPSHGVKLEPGDVYEFERPNAFVNTGLQNSLDRLFGLGGTAVTSIGIAEDASAVTAATTFLGGAAAAILSGGTQNGFIRTISPAASRASQTVTAGATFTQADMAGRAFAIHKVGLLTAATDTGSALVDVIGGSGSAPYNQPFTVDLTGTTTWSLTMQIQVTASAT